MMDFEKNQNKGSLMYSGIHISTEEQNETNDNKNSCIEGISEKGTWITYLICFIIGLIIILISFDFKHHDFCIWFIFGNFSLVLGLLFVAKPSYHLNHLNVRKRKEFLGLYLISVILILILKVIVHGGEILVALLFFAEIVGYFQYARTYIERFDNLAKRILGNFCYYSE